MRPSYCRSHPTSSHSCLAGIIDPRMLKHCEGEVIFVPSLMKMRYLVEELYRIQSFALMCRSGDTIRSYFFIN